MQSRTLKLFAAGMMMLAMTACQVGMGPGGGAPNMAAPAMSPAPATSAAPAASPAPATSAEPAASPSPAASASAAATTP